MGGARARSGLRGGLCGLSQVRIQRRVGEHPNIVYMKELVETPDRSCLCSSWQAQKNEASD